MFNNSSISRSLFAPAALVAATTLATPALADVITDSPNGFALRSNDSITLGGDSKVAGSVGAIKDVKSEWGSFVDGDIVIGSTSSWFTPKLPTWASGGDRVRLGWAETVDLRAGSYGSLNADSSCTIGLSAGTYAFDSFSIGWDTTVVADTSAGDVYVLVSGALKAGDETRFKTSGEGSLYLITTGDASFGYKADVNALVYSAGKMSFGGSSTLSGLAFSEKSMTTGYGSQFAYIIPGPASLALIPFAAGLAYGGGRRRRR